MINWKKISEDNPLAIENMTWFWIGEKFANKSFKKNNPIAYKKGLKSTFKQIEKGGIRMLFDFFDSRGFEINIYRESSPFFNHLRWSKKH